MEPTCPMPALLTKMSRRLRRETAAAMEAGLVTSRCRTWAEPSELARASAAARLMSAIQTKAPARTSSFTVASPMPLAPPVTRAWRPSRRKGCGSEGRDGRFDGVVEVIVRFRFDSTGKGQYTRAAMNDTGRRIGDENGAAQRRQTFSGGRGNTDDCQAAVRGDSGAAHREPAWAYAGGVVCREPAVSRPGGSVCAAGPLRFPDAVQPGSLARRTGDRQGADCRAAQGVADLCQQLSPVSRHADTAVAGLRLSGAVRADGTAIGGHGGSLLRHNRG